VLRRGVLGDVRLKKLYNDILWTHKIQEKQADIYSEKASKWKAASIACVALTGSGLLTGLLSSIYVIQVISVFIAAISLFVTVYREAMDYESKSHACAISATEFLALRSRAEKIACDAVGDKCDKGLKGELQQLTDLYEALCRTAPRTNDEAVKRAEGAKADGEFSEMEMDG